MSIVSVPRGVWGVGEQVVRAVSTTPSSPITCVVVNEMIGVVDWIYVDFVEEHLAVSDIDDKLPDAELKRTSQQSPYYIIYIIITYHTSCIQ